ncbi:MAG: hypothetical protein ACKV0T_22025 [Planctomycetales bacterium]
MLGGILIIGVGLISAALLWGHRVRRIARQPLPKVAPHDPFWHLKGPKGPAAETSSEAPPSSDPPNEQPT